MAEAKSKIRFYKYVTPPKDAGATISVGNKTIAGSNFTATINAVNSLGATVNSIAVALQGQRAAQQTAQAQADRRAQLQRDRQREGRLESTKGKAKEIVGGVVKGGASFLENLLKFLKDFLIFTALDWLSDPANRERIQKVVDGIGNFFNWMRDTFNWVTEWISENWEKTFGEDKTWRERLEGASGLLLGAGAALLGLAFLKDPIGTIANFTKIITTVGKGILNIGKALGGTALGQVAMGATQGYFAYQDVMENYDGPEEDRVAAARGAAVGATTGAVGLGMLGNKIAGPLGGIIGNALGGFLGKEAGKFLGPIVGDFFKTMQDVFGNIMSFLEETFKPVGEALEQLFVEMGPAIDKLTQFIKPHLPKLKEIAEFIGKIAFQPLILLLKGVTNLLKLVNGGKAEDPTNKAEPTEEKSAGGLFRMPPLLSKGGWISGPQSGYPVSMDGGKSVSFIGHGTEYVAQRSSGGFVIPFDTPHTRRDPGLTGRRMAQAKSYGYKTPEFSIGGQFNYANAFTPTFNKTVNIPSPTYSKLPQRSIGGFVKGIASAAGSIFGGPAVGAAMGMLGNVAGAAQNITKAAMPVISSVIPGGNITGKFLSDALAKVKTAAAEVKAGNMEEAVKTIVAEAIVLPTATSQTGAAGGEGTPVPIPSAENPATDFLKSRFGSFAELANPLSNFF